MPTSSATRMIRATSTLFSVEPKESHEQHDIISALTLLRLAGIDKPENKEIMKAKNEYLSGIIRVLDNLNQLEILSQSNFDKVMQLVPPPDPQKQSLARLGFALDRLRNARLLNNENGQLYFEKLVEKVTLASGKDFLNQLDLYTKEITSSRKNPGKN